MFCFISCSSCTLAIETKLTIAFAMSECVRAMKAEFQDASTNYENKAQSDSDFELELNRCILLGRGFYTQNEGNGGMWVR